jgi:hypothetical protein
MDKTPLPGPRMSADALGIFAGVIMLFGSGVLAGLGLGRLLDGDLASGALLAALGAVMAWATLWRGPARPEV